MPPPARILVRRTVLWALVADAVPIYPLYALLFTAHGLSVAQVSWLFAIWSAVAMLTEVPSGALADRFSRRGCLVAAGVFQAAGYALWTALPGFPGFAAGFVLWGFGSSLVTGALESLLYEGMRAAGAEHEYVRVYGWVDAMELVGQLPAAAAATVLFTHGGYPLVGWSSVATCLTAAALAARLPEPPRPQCQESHFQGVSRPESGFPDTEGEGELGYLATLRAGIGDAVRAPAVRGVLVVLMLLGAIDTAEEYFPLLWADWGVPEVMVPLAGLPVVLAGVAGAALAGRTNALPPWALGLVLGVAMLLLGGAGLAGHPAGIIAVALFYGGYRAVLVVVEARLQERIADRSRATVTSVASFGMEIAVFAVYAIWASGGPVLLAALGLLMAAALTRLPVIVARSRPGVRAAGPRIRRPRSSDGPASTLDT